MTHNALLIYLLIFLITFAVTIIIERRLIPVLKAVAKQPIYTDGPKWHNSKYGTPTMGGLAFIIASVISVFLGCLFLSGYKDKYMISLLLTMLLATSNAVIGIIDDRAKLKRKQNEGLTPKQKILFQSIAAVIFLYLRSIAFEDDTVLYFSFGRIDAGFIYYPISLLIILLAVNSANLTDGIDGLASSVAFGTGMSLLYISAFSNPATAITASVIIGSSLAFLTFNLHPAKIFMGDTGSLFLGGIIAASGFSMGNPILIIPISGVYIIEGFSVIIQVLVYKLTKKRIFKMAPLHHHFEKSGWSENRICLVGIFATLILSFPAFLLYGY